MEPDRTALRRQLLAWYRARKRDLPFRRTGDPYAILVAEVILQRTRVKAGVPYYERFLEAFPSVGDLASAPEADVLRVWEGLGFYRRARNLHRAAQAIVSEFGGELPRDFEALRSLPGVGAYTAGAVASIAFGLRVPAVDGNATRVLSRLYRIEDDPTRPAARRRISALAAELVPAVAPGEWNQAMMELGATVCLPRAPNCAGCPVSRECIAFAAGVQGSLPRPRPRARVPRVSVVFAVVWRGRRVLLVRRGGGLHAGMYALPGGPVEPGESEEEAARRHLRSFGLELTALGRHEPVRHAFSHLRWEGVAYRCRVRGRAAGGVWLAAQELRSVPVVPVHRGAIDRLAGSN